MRLISGSGKDCVYVCGCVLVVVGVCSRVLAAKVMCIITAQLLSHINSNQMCIAY